MRRRLRLLTLALAWTATTAVGAVAADGAAPAAAELPSRQQVQAAAQTVRADPDLPGTRASRTLRFKSSEDDEDKPTPPKPSDSDSLAWLRELIDQLVEGARWLVWLLGAAAVAWVLMRLRRWARLRGEARLDAPPAPPSHVGSLDIRPGSLPADLGAAAATLWQRGQARAALSLLYRGALSRLVHGHGVPIRSASTEEECLSLARHRLAAADQAFLTELVQLWQRMAYGGQAPHAERVLALCADFDTHLRAAPAPVQGGTA